MTHGTTHPYDCDRFADTLADFLERDVDEPTRAAMEAHALVCDDCGALLADLRTLRVDAENLPELAPSRDLWAGIAERIEAPVVPIDASRAARPSVPGARRMPAWVRTGLAAAALVGATAGLTHWLTRAALRPAAPLVATQPTRTTPSPTPVRDSAISPAPAPQVVAAQPEPEPVTTRRAPRAALVANTKAAASVTYDREIARLRVVLDRRRGQLDPATVAVIERNLTVIDDAIAQCRRALARDPESRFLIESLNDAFENKIQLMRTAATLPSRT